MKAEDLRAARKELGFKSQADLARELETAPDTVRAWESGKRPIPGPARVAVRLLLERMPADPPATLHARLDAAFAHAERLVLELDGKPGRTIAKETRDRIRVAMESAALLDAAMN